MKLIIEGTREELLAFLGKTVIAPKTEFKADKKIILEKEEKSSHGVKKARCCDCVLVPDSKECQTIYQAGKCPRFSSPVQSCAYCGKHPGLVVNNYILVGNLMTFLKPQNNFSLDYVYDSPSNDLSGKENIPVMPLKSCQDDHMKLQAYISDCLRHGLDYSDILFSLKQFKGISMSPAELGSIIMELAELQDRE
jgi:hypothetical protein